MSVKPGLSLLAIELSAYFGMLHAADQSPDHMSA